MCVDVPWRLEDVVRCSARCAVLELLGISGTVGAESMLCGSKVCTLSTGSRSHRSFWELGTLRSATNPYPNAARHGFRDDNLRSLLGAEGGKPARDNEELVGSLEELVSEDITPRQSHVRTACTLQDSIRPRARVT